MKENVIVTKSYAYTIHVVKLYEYLKGEKQEFVLAKLVLRTGTSIGTNTEEAVAGR